MQHEWDIREKLIGFGGERERMRRLWRSSTWIEISGGCCCHGNEILSFLMYEEFHDQMWTYWLLKRSCAAFNESFINLINNFEDGKNVIRIVWIYIGNTFVALRIGWYLQCYCRLRNSFIFALLILPYGLVDICISVAALRICWYLRCYCSLRNRLISALLLPPYELVDICNDIVALRICWYLQCYFRLRNRLTSAVLFSPYDLVDICTTRVSKPIIYEKFKWKNVRYICISHIISHITYSVP